MGALFTKLWNTFGGGNKEYRLLMLGLDAAGKTTILYKMKLNEVVNTIPTIGFNVETFEYKHITFNCWDIGGQHKLRTMWQHYFDNVDALVYVIDSADIERVEENKETLMGLLNEDALRDAQVLVYANKQDLPNALTCPQLVEKLGLATMRRKWQIQGCSGKTGSGLIEGMDWLSNSLLKK